MTEPEELVGVGGNTAVAEGAEAEKAEAGIDAAEVKEKGTPGAAPESKRRIPLVPIVVIVALVVAVAVVAGLVLPGRSSRLTKSDFDTAVALDKAIAIENLSTAEFVYNGIAEHYREEGEERNPLFFWESDDPVNYRICYKATVKMGIDMKDVDFVVDEEAKTVKAKLPEFTLACHVDPNDMQFIPEGTDANMQTVLQICEEDVENEAQRSEKLYETAKENLQSTIEALTQPILSVKGYTMTWEEGGSHE